MKQWIEWIKDLPAQWIENRMKSSNKVHVMSFSYEEERLQDVSSFWIHFNRGCAELSVKQQITWWTFGFWVSPSAASRQVHMDGWLDDQTLGWNGKSGIAPVIPLQWINSLPFFSEPVTLFLVGVVQVWRHQFHLTGFLLRNTSDDRGAVFPVVICLSNVRGLSLGQQSFLAVRIFQQLPLHINKIKHIGVQRDGWRWRWWWWW